MGSPERPSGPGNKESNQRKKTKEGRIRVRSSKGFKHSYVKNLLGTDEYHPEGSVVDAEKLLEEVLSTPKLVQGGKRVRVY